MSEIQPWIGISSLSGCEAPVSKSPLSKSGHKAYPRRWCVLTVQTHKTRFYIWSVMGGFLIGLTSTTCMFYFYLWKWSDVQETVNSPLGDAVSSSNSWLIFVFILCFYNDQIIPNWTKLGLLEDIAYCCWEKKRQQLSICNA